MGRRRVVLQGLLAIVTEDAVHKVIVTGGPGFIGSYEAHPHCVVRGQSIEDLLHQRTVS
jgi:hypothetical protein